MRGVNRPNELLEVGDEVECKPRKRWMNLLELPSVSFMWTYTSTKIDPIINMNPAHYFRFCPAGPIWSFATVDVVAILLGSRLEVLAAAPIKIQGVVLSGGFGRCWQANVAVAAWAARR